MTFSGCFLAVSKIVNFNFNYCILIPQEQHSEHHLILAKKPLEATVVQSTPCQWSYHHLVDF